MPPKKGKSKEKTGEGSKRAEEHPSTTNDIQVNHIIFKNEKDVTKNMITKFRKNQR